MDLIGCSRSCPGYDSLLGKRRATRTILDVRSKSNQIPKFEPDLPAISRWKSEGGFGRESDSERAERLDTVGQKAMDNLLAVLPCMSLPSDEDSMPCLDDGLPN